MVADTACDPLLFRSSSEKDNYLVCGKVRYKYFEKPIGVSLPTSMTLPKSRAIHNRGKNKASSNQFKRKEVNKQNIMTRMKIPSVKESSLHSRTDHNLQDRIFDLRSLSLGNVMYKAKGAVFDEAKNQDSKVVDEQSEALQKHEKELSDEISRIVKEYQACLISREERREVADVVRVMEDMVAIVRAEGDHAPDGPREVIA